MHVTRANTPVVIELTSAEAKLLKTFFGHLSRSKVGAVLGIMSTESLAYDTHALTNAIHEALYYLPL